MSPPAAGASHASRARPAEPSSLPSTTALDAYWVKTCMAGNWKHSSAQRIKGSRGITATQYPWAKIDLPKSEKELLTSQMLN